MAVGADALPRWRAYDNLDSCYDLDDPVPESTVTSISIRACCEQKGSTAAVLKLVAEMMIVVAVVGGCGAFGEKSDPTKNWSAQQLYRAAKGKLDEGDYEVAVDYYEKLESRYPFGPLAEQGQIEIAYAHYRNEEPASAIAAADRFIKLHPQHPNVDYAYYIKGLTNFNRGKGLLERILPKDPSERDPGAALQSFKDFDALATKFPGSRYAADASQRMLFLKNTLAQHEVHVANYYMRRGAYVAAVNRARYVVENYQETPVVPEALVILAKGYKLMDLPDLSADALRVLKLNYPRHQGVAEVEALLIQ